MTQPDPAYLTAEAVAFYAGIERMYYSTTPGVRPAAKALAREVLAQRAELRDLRARQLVLEGALRKLRSWDMLTVFDSGERDPHDVYHGMRGSATADAPWACKLIDDALEET